MQLIVQKKGYRLLPFLLLAVAMAALIFIASDTQAVHSDGLLEMDGNVEFDGGDGVDPGITPCPYPSTTPFADPVDCIGAAGPLAAFDWQDDDPNVISGQQGLCRRSPGGGGLPAAGLITETSPLPSGVPAGADVKCTPDIVLGATDDLSYHTGSDKDFQDISDPADPGATDVWRCVDSANATSKADLLNAGFVLATGGDGHQLFYAMAERDSEHGDVFDGFWIVQEDISVDGDPIDCSASSTNCPAPQPPCKFSGVHECGDVLILFNYESGGRVGTSAALQWQRAIPTGGTTPVDLLGCNGVDDGAAGFGFPDTGDDCEKPEGPGIASHAPLCLITLAGNDCRVEATGATGNFCGRVNAETTCQPVPKTTGCDGLILGPDCFTTPWEPNDGSCPAGGAAPPTFAETGIDLTAFDIGIPCVGAFIAESRSSSSVDATLKDFALAPTGVQCTSSVETEIHAGSNADPTPHDVLTDCTGNTPPSCGPTGTVRAGDTVHDSASLTLAGGAGTADGTLTFTLYDNSTCDGNVIGTPEDVTVSQAVGTTIDYESADFITQAGMTGISYKVSYTGDADLQIPGSDSICEPLRIINPSENLFKFATVATTASYTYRKSNTGDADLFSVTVVDDTCSPLARGSDDPGNDDNVLNPGETWVFTCSMAITADTTNTATGNSQDELGNAVGPEEDTVTITAPVVTENAPNPP